MRTFSGLSVLPAAGSAAAPVAPWAAVDAVERGYEVRLQRSERTFQRLPPRDQNVVEIRPRVFLLYVSHGGLETAPDPIALDRLADLTGDREAKAWTGRCAFAQPVTTLLGLDHEGRRRPTGTLADALKFRARFQRDDPREQVCRCLRQSLGRADPVRGSVHA